MVANNYGGCRGYYSYLSFSLSAAWPASSFPGGRLKYESQIIELVQNNESRKGVGITYSLSPGILQQEAFLRTVTSAVPSDLREQSRPAPVLLIMQFPAHQLMPLFSGFYEDQRLQLGKGAEAELQEEALSHQAPPGCERKCLSGTSVGTGLDVPQVNLSHLGWSGSH